MLRTTRDRLIRSFNVDELRDLCLLLGLSSDNFPPTLSAFARDLTLYIHRAGMWAEFAEAVKGMRPSVDWSYINTSGSAAAQPAAQPAVSGKLPEEEKPQKTARQHAGILIDLLAALPEWDTEPERRAFLVVNNLQGIEDGCDLHGSRRDAAVSLMSAILRFNEADPWFVSDSFAALYDAAATTGLFSAPKRVELAREAAALRQR